MQPPSTRRLFILLLSLYPSPIKASANDNGLCNSTEATSYFISIYGFPTLPDLPSHRDFRFENFLDYSVVPNAATVGIDTELYTCVEHPYSFNKSLALSFVGCEALTGGFFHSYQSYEILGRLHAWKAPVAVLVVLTPRAPLGLATWVFTLLHLCADPGDTIASLLYTLAVCRTRVQRLKKRRRGGQVRGLEAEDWKVIVLLISSYDEYGNTKAADALEKLYVFQI
jgi:hypothetical protein